MTDIEIIYTLRKYKACGYKYMYFEDFTPWFTHVPPKTGDGPWIPIEIKPRAVAVDWINPWDDAITIDAAIADPSLLRGRDMWYA